MTVFADTEQTVSLNIVKIVSCYILGFPCGSAGKESPAMQETQVQSLGWEDPLDRGKATLWPGVFHKLYSPWGHKESDTTERLSPHLLYFTTTKI